MGRRKIEIQPITHERNRSVTFLKRKNGLFKKAYELGVLCSVDVAVIIFEDRPGHQRKLYQYCSSDVHDIVQQHLRHDGERDTRGPVDFSGTPSTRNDDAGDVDEDYGEDDDDDIPPSATRKRAKGDGSVGKLKPAHSQDSMTNSDMDYNPRLPQHSGHGPSTFGFPPAVAHALAPHHTSHPMSSDRLRPSHQHLHKKPKLGIHDHGGEDRGHGHPEDSGSVGGRSEYTFPPPSSSPSFRHPQHPSSSSLHQVSYGGPQYSQSGFFSSTPTSSVPPSSYMHSQADISSSRGRSFGNTAAGAYSPQSRSRPSTAQGGGSNTGDMLAAYLDAEPSTSRRVSSAVTGGSGVVGPTSSAFSLDWPATQSSSSGSGMAHTTSPSSTTSTNSAQGGNSGSHWLDFLSGNNTPTQGQGHAQSHPATPTSSGPRTNAATQQISSAQGIAWAAQQRPRPDTSVSGRNHRVSSRASGRDGSGSGASIDVEQLFGAGASRVGEVKKEG